jgi:hypothetical protein
VKYHIELVSCAMIYIPSSVKIGSGVQTLIGGDTQTHRHTARLSHKHTFFRNMQSRLKSKCEFYLERCHLVPRIISYAKI